MQIIKIFYISKHIHIVKIKWNISWNYLSSVCPLIFQNKNCWVFIHDLECNLCRILRKSKKHGTICFMSSSFLEIRPNCVSFFIDVRPCLIWPMQHECFSNLFTHQYIFAQSFIPLPFLYFMRFCLEITLTHSYSHYVCECVCSDYILIVFIFQ